LECIKIHDAPFGWLSWILFFKLGNHVVVVMGFFVFTLLMLA